MISRILLNTRLPLPLPKSNPLVRARCLSLLMLCKKVIASYLPLYANCTAYCGGDSACKALRH
jgi:hypothetical protein